MEESEGEDIKIIVTLEKKNKAQARLIGDLKIENKDMKKICHILEDREHVFKEDIYDLKNKFGKAKKIDEEIGSQLKNKISNCEKLKSELENRMKRKNEEENEENTTKCSNNNKRNHHQNIVQVKSPKMCR